MSSNTSSLTTDTAVVDTTRQFKPETNTVVMGINGSGCIYGYGQTPNNPAFTLEKNEGLVFWSKPVLRVSHHFSKGQKTPYLNFIFQTFNILPDLERTDEVVTGILKMRCGGLVNPDTGKKLIQCAPTTLLGDLESIIDYHLTSNLDLWDIYGTIYTSRGSKGGIFANIFNTDNRPVQGTAFTRDPLLFEDRVCELCRKLDQPLPFSQLIGVNDEQDNRLDKVQAEQTLIEASSRTGESTTS